MTTEEARALAHELLFPSKYDASTQHDRLAAHILATDAAHAEQLKTTERLRDALDIAHRYGGIDGAHHKMWVIDQMVRALTGNGYRAWVKVQKAGEDGPDTYEWDEGIAP